MKRDDAIAEVSIDASGRLHVRPSTEQFPFVWRAAMEVHWDAASGTLHSPPPRAWSYVDWFVQIVAAVKDEYGFTLALTRKTRWVNVPTDLRQAIIAATGHEA